MLEKILIDVCQKMSESLDEEQLEKLKNTLFIVFHGKEIVEEKNEIIVSNEESDQQKMEMFVASKKVSGRKNNTLKQYVNELKACRAAIGKNFEDITSMDLKWYLGILKEKKGNKITTIRNKIRYLNSFYTFLVKEEMILKNPVDKIETPKMDYTIKKPFSVQEMESIRKACGNPRDRALVEFMYSTGLRVSEVCSLDVSDIDLYQKRFTVTGKGSKERIVYVSDAACFHLKEYLRWRSKKEKIDLEDLSKKPLFVSLKGAFERISSAGIEYICRQIGKVSGISNVHPHRFRRTFATGMIKRGMKLEELMKLMGHTKMDTTLIYCEVDQENVRNSYYKYAA